MDVKHQQCPVKIRFTVPFWHAAAQMKASTLRFQSGPIVVHGELERSGSIRVDSVSQFSRDTSICNGQLHNNCTSLNALGLLWIYNSIEEFNDINPDQLASEAIGK